MSYNTSAWYQPGFNIPATPNLDSLIRPDATGSFELVLGPGTVEEYQSTLVTPERRVIAEYGLGEHNSIKDSVVVFTMPANVLDGGETAIIQVRKNNKVTEYVVSMQELS